MYRPTPTAVMGTMITRARGREFSRYDIKQQPVALGAENASADAVV